MTALMVCTATYNGIKHKSLPGGSLYAVKVTNKPFTFCISDVFQNIEEIQQEAWSLIEKTFPALEVKAVHLDFGYKH